MKNSHIIEDILKEIHSVEHGISDGKRRKNLIQIIKNPHLSYNSKEYDVYKYLVDQGRFKQTFSELEVKEFILDIPFMFSTKEIIEYKLGGIVGCTGYSKVLFEKAVERGIKSKYVITVDKLDYIKYEKMILGGHQVVAVFNGDSWNLIDATTRSADAWICDDSGRRISYDPKASVGKDIRFDGIDKTCIILGFYDDLTHVSSFNSLMDLSKRAASKSTNKTLVYE